MTEITAPTHYYNFDEASGDLIDQVGSTDGAVNNATQGATGKISDAYDFDGSGDNVDLNSEVVSEGETCTINCWVKTGQSSQVKYVISQSADNQGRQRIGIRQNLTEWEAVSSESDQDQIFQSATTNADTSNFQMITYIRDTDEVRIYINGTQENGETAWDGTDISNSNHMFIGTRASPSSAQDFDGIIDEMGIWVGTVLSDAEITALYNGGSGVAYPFPTSATVEPTALALTLSQGSQDTTVQHDASVTSIGLSLKTPKITGDITPEHDVTLGKGTRIISKNWPHVSGIMGRYSKQEGRVMNLVPQSSKVLRKNRKGL